MKRLEKYTGFQQFYKNSKNIFKEVVEKYDNHKNLTREYNFIVVPGSRNGGLNEHIVEAFFGNINYRRTKIVGPQFNISEQTETAQGAALSYVQIDNGNIHVVLYPAYTESHRSSEECIVLDYIKNPKKLLSKQTIKKHWKYLSSYMAVTSIDEDYCFIDKLRVAYIRFAKQTILQKDFGEKYETKLRKFLKTVIIQILTVGFSGFLLAFIPFFINKDNKISQMIDIIIEEQERIKNLHEEIKEEIDQLLRKDNKTVLQDNDISENNNKKINNE
jgi:hypothetical protein